MKTRHRLFTKDARSLAELDPASVDLMVTSPPYPMIEMWDLQFSARSPAIADALASENGPAAFDLMHSELNEVWKQADRVLKTGSFVCVNVGDAARSVGTEFRLYPNHVRIVEDFLKLGFSMLPGIIWRKQTNKPNKYMGSGMLPAGAYVTLEHEWILIFRKGPKRVFKGEQQANRTKSAFFWEERNSWFSDVWSDLKGTTQSMVGDEVRERSGAFPLDLAYRLVNMYSLIGDTVLDPFVGTGTTSVAAICSARNSVGFEIDPSIQPVLKDRIGQAVGIGKQATADRLARHKEFIRQRLATGAEIKYKSSTYGFPVVSEQEVGLVLPVPDRLVSVGPEEYEVDYREPFF
jgi:modification methylase